MRLFDARPDAGTANHRVETPVNRRDGQDCIVLPSVPNDVARRLFPKGCTEVKPHLRVTPQPNRRGPQARDRFSWLTSRSSVWHTVATSSSVIELKKGSAIVRWLTLSAMGNMPGPVPSRSR